MKLQKVIDASVSLGKHGGLLMAKKKQEDMADHRPAVGELWKTDSINWDLIQRMRFMNADAEIDPEDSYSKGEKKFDED